MPDTSGEWLLVHIQSVALTGANSPAGLLEPHLFQLAVQSLALNAQDLGRAALVAVRCSKDAADLLGFSVRQCLARAFARIHLLDRVTHGSSVDAAARSKNRQPFDDTLQLANVSRPAIFLQRFQSRFLQSRVETCIARCSA